MRFVRPALLLLAASLISVAAFAQPPQRDPQAVAILQKSVAAMGTAVPTDSVATGTIRIIAGSSNDDGTIRILTRGLDQSAEEIQTPQSHYTLVYSRGRADDKRSGLPLSLDLAVTSQSTSFPLPLIAGTLSDPEYAFQYLGPEDLNGEQVHHIRLWKSFASNPKLFPLAELSKRDLWISLGSNIPRKLSYVRRASHSPGSIGIPIEVWYADYHNLGVLRYPFSINLSVNGIPWAVVKITNVILNSGLTDSDFPVSMRRGK